MGLAAAVDTVLATFRSAQWNGAPLRVFDDSALVNPPCVWLPVPDLAFRFHKGCIEVTWTAYLVAPPSSTTSVSSTLSGLLDAVTGLFPFLDATATPLTLPGGGQPAPSYQVTWNDRIPIGA
jgi:hypothetical protein